MLEYVVFGFLKFVAFSSRVLATKAGLLQKRAKKIPRLIRRGIQNPSGGWAIREVQTIASEGALKQWKNCTAGLLAASVVLLGRFGDGL
ncbi:hypothetical protein [Rhodocyclus tenuis]|uniref:Uncharacterized protein n=1 Tax=Rhodocyclus tenuis TaxID=1066 RepID=A0A840G4G7_RHOTE|nr:hypothetical protein [Rhodocyclus tenuis]MBB4246826.1 hypothetical protein [Rhodocyclus tenuis]